MNTMTTTTTTQQSKENKGVGCVDDNKDSNDKDVGQGQGGYFHSEIIQRGMNFRM